MKPLPPNSLDEIALVAEYVQENGEVYPAVKLLTTFESFSPACVAAYMVCLYEAFEHLLPEEKQVNFQQTTIKCLLEMIDKKDQYVERFLEGPEEE